MTAKKKLGARAMRRQADRNVQKFMRDKTRLAALEVGGAPERPIQVTSASEVEISARSMPCIQCGGEVRVEVEISARSMPCIQCGGEVRVDEHLAETIGADRLRITHVSCPSCGTKRAIYFRIGSPLPN
jgi:hypothetical protein